MNSQLNEVGSEITDSNQTQSSQNVVGNGTRRSKTAKAHSRVKRLNGQRKRTREGQLISATRHELENVGTSNLASRSNSSIEIIDVEQVKEKPVVDLTDETMTDVYVDLTASPDMYHHRRQTVIRWPSVPQRPLHNSFERRNRDISDEILVVPSGSERVVNITSESSSTSENIMTCAICMDDYDQIKQSKRQLTSTTCGHVFCDPCITSSMRSQSKCPTCRKRLTKKALHPLFL